MRLDVRHPRQRFPISAIHHTTDPAHAWLIPLRFVAHFCFQFINLGFRVEHLHRLKAAVDQARDAVEESKAQKIPIAEEQDR
jgi:hypothetical protein